MSTTDNPPPYMRRRVLLAWLSRYGYAEGQVDQWIRDGLIPKTRILTPRHEVSGKTPRAYYMREEVIEALKLDPKNTTHAKN